MFDVPEWSYAIIKTSGQVLYLLPQYSGRTEFSLASCLGKFISLLCDFCYNNDEGLAATLVQDLIVLHI